MAKRLLRLCLATTDFGQCMLFANGPIMYFFMAPDGVK